MRFRFGMHEKPMLDIGISILALPVLYWLGLTFAGFLTKGEVLFISIWMVSYGWAFKFIVYSMGQGIEV